MVGVILFRAQPFHNGHLHMVKTAMEDCKKKNMKLYIVVGSADKVGTKRNPIPIADRIKLIKNSLLHEMVMKDYSKEIIPFIHVAPLRDLSDESNNTYSWGDYLYKSLCDITHDNQFSIYYSDNPKIMLSWFDKQTKKHFDFHFLKRHEGISATKVRELILKGDDETLKKCVPIPVYNCRQELREYLKSAK